MDTTDVTLREVMLRDGLQNITEFIPTEAKVELFRLLVASGIRDAEITSFVNPKAVPQFRDAARMAQAALKIKPEEVRVSALIPNLKGAELALNSGLRNLAFVMSVSESHNISNVRRSTEESLDELKKILDLHAEYPGLAVRVGMATVFGCPFEGKIKPRVTLDFIRRFYRLGVRNIALSDTVGFGNPREVKELAGTCVGEFPDVIFSIHLHNTRGLGLANSLAAYESGIRIHDGAVGGLGGCPFAPGAKGNTSTEDLVFMFEEMGVSTGVDLAALMEASRYFKKIKGDVSFSSAILEVGVPSPKGAMTKDGFQHPVRGRT
ncbi:MAG: hydroxymethylglutaryl-CoA lyase [Deltaproteobacteria bacterium]|nr:hydroxymethylglutaryl-CoA lyase [Deltaproteobacteria bacterium]